VHPGSVARVSALIVAVAALSQPSLTHAQPLGAGAAGDAADRDARTSALTVAPTVRLFFDACVRPEAELAGAVDAALGAGWDPADTAEPALAALLGGEGGQVFASPSDAPRAWLAVTPRGRCTLWLERAHGPAVRHAFLQAIDGLSATGRTQVVLDRAVERAGAWRQHLMVRYRRGGGDRDHALGLVSTLGDAGGAQALQFAPAAALPGGAGPARDPDGQAVR
jgi:hypothetical protein